MTTAMKAKKELLASQVSNLVSDTNENLLRVNLSKFFTDLEAEIQKALIEYWNDTLLLQGQINLILSPIHEKHQEYYELIMTHKLQEFRRAQKLGERLVKREQEKVAMKAAQPVKFIHNEDNLFGTLEYTEERLSDYTFTASQNTLNRVDGNINEILTTGYREGKGINEVSRKITERFDQLRTWEAKRIARTEIHTSQNMGIMSSYESLGVEYTQWSAAHDSRTRHSHIEIDGEIIPFGGTYSNKLRFPGDTSGPIEEWINCRCANAPFVVPYGYIAPSFSPFREEDLIPVESVNPLEPVVEQPVSEPTSRVQGNYETFTEYDKRSKAENTVYRFESGLEVAVNAKAQLTFEEVQSHINQLPKPLRNIDTLNRINICGHHDGSAGGRFYPKENKVEVYLTAGNKVQQLDTLNHELAHALDWKMGGEKITVYGYSKTEIYEKIFNADNKLHIIVNERTGRKRTPKIFVTDYAARSFTKYKKQFQKHMRVWEKSSKTTPKPEDFRFGEDFADSTKKYLNPSDHAQFVEKFPNRAEYLESIYGKPTFSKDNIHSRVIREEEIAKQERLLKQQTREKIKENLNTLESKELKEYLKQNLTEKEANEYVKIKEKYDNALAKTKAIERAVAFEEGIAPLLEVGYSKKEAESILNNPNKYLKQARDERYKYQDRLNELDDKIIKKLTK